jgi:hypothetical protein
MKPAAAFIALAVSAGASFGADGSIPIYQSTMITQPGSYVLTRDIASAGGDTIVVASGNVTINLNGRTISSNSTSDALIRIQPGASPVQILNGRLSGGGYGILASGVATVEIENVHFSNPATSAIDVRGATRVSIIRSVIEEHASCVQVAASRSAPLARTSGCTIPATSHCTTSTPTWESTTNTPW